MLPQHHGNLREVVQAVAEGIDIHHGPAGDHERLVSLGEKPVDEGDGIGLIHAGGIVLGDGNRLDEVMLHPRELFRGGNGRADAHFLI